MLLKELVKTIPPIRNLIRQRDFLRNENRTLTLKLERSRNFPLVQAGVKSAPIDREEKERLIASQSWWHSIPIEADLVTPGKTDLFYLRKLANLMEIPSSLEGLTVLDIGAWDGYFSFEAERRGAKRVIAYDVFPAERCGFNIARKLLNSKVEYIQGSVYDLSPAVHGTFDVVFFFGVFYHLRHPLLALDRLWQITNQYVLMETHYLDNHLVLGPGDSVPLSEIDKRLKHLALCQFYRHDELNHGDSSNWFAFTQRGVEESLWSAGFKPEFLGSWVAGHGIENRCAYKAVKMPGPPEHEKYSCQ